MRLCEIETCTVYLTIALCIRLNLGEETDSETAETSSVLVTVTKLYRACAPSHRGYHITLQFSTEACCPSYMQT